MGLLHRVDAKTKNKKMKLRIIDSESEKQLGVINGDNPIELERIESTSVSDLQCHQGDGQCEDGGKDDDEEAQQPGLIQQP
jgi:hypothetical protein